MTAGKYAQGALKAAERFEKFAGKSPTREELEDAAADLLVQQILHDSTQREVFGNLDRNDVPKIKARALKVIKEQRGADERRRSRRKDS